MSYDQHELLEKWRPVLDDETVGSITDPDKRHIIATLLENQEHDAAEQSQMSGTFGLLGEAAPTNHMGGSSSSAGDGGIDVFDPVLISLVRRSMPNLVSYDVMGVQPMTGPSGLIFAIRSRYTNQEGTEALFNEADTAFSGQSSNTSIRDAGYTFDETTEHRQTNPRFRGTGSGSVGSKEGTFNPTLAAQMGTDPTLRTAAGGAYSVATGMTTAQAEALGDGRNNDFQEMAFSIEKVTATAKSRALKAEYTIELAQDLKAIHGLDAETELSRILSAEIITEINREMLRTINWTATTGAQHNVATQGRFDLDVDANGRWSVERFKGLIFQMEREANAIARATRRGKGNVMICSSDTASALHMAKVLDYTPELASKLNVDDTGNTFAGILNGRIRVHIDPYFESSTGAQYFTMGYKGASQFDAGLFYAPYVPLQMVRAIDARSFQPAIGFKSRYTVIANPFAVSDLAANPNDGENIRHNSNIYYRLVAIENLM